MLGGVSGSLLAVSGTQHDSDPVAPSQHLGTRIMGAIAVVNPTEQTLVFCPAALLTCSSCASHNLASFCGTATWLHSCKSQPHTRQLHMCHHADVNTVETDIMLC